MMYRKPRVERCVTDTGYTTGWVVLVDRGCDELEAFDVDTWAEGIAFAVAWYRVMLDVVAA